MSVCSLCTKFFLFVFVKPHRGIWRVQINWLCGDICAFSKTIMDTREMYIAREVNNSVQLKIGFKFNCNQTISSSVILSSIEFLAAVQVVVYAQSNNHMCTPSTFGVACGYKHTIDTGTCTHFNIMWSNDQSPDSIRCSTFYYGLVSE